MHKNKGPSKLQSTIQIIFNFISKKKIVLFRDESLYTFDVNFLFLYYSTSIILSLNAGDRHQSTTVTL